MHALIQPVVLHHAAAFLHHSHGGYGYGIQHGHGSWIASMVVSALVHALVYGAVFRLMRHLTMPEVLLLAGGGLLLVYAWSRSRDRRGW